MPARRYRATRKSYDIRNKKGQFREFESVRRSVQDERTDRSIHATKPGYGFRGDASGRHGYVVAQRVGKGQYNPVSTIRANKRMAVKQMKEMRRRGFKNLRVIKV